MQLTVDVLDPEVECKELDTSKEPVPQTTES